MVLQTAVDVAEAWGRRWGLALSLLLNRVLPALDRLTDALAQGYWAAVVDREEDSRARYEHLVERSSDGIYELDTTGRVSYANASLAAMVGVNPDAIDEPAWPRCSCRRHARRPRPALLDEVDEADADVRDRARPTGCGVSSWSASRRRHEGHVAGYQGVVRDMTAARETDGPRTSFWR